MGPGNGRTSAADRAEVPRGIEAAIEPARGSGRAIVPGVRTQMEAVLDTDLADVRVHTDSRANSLSRTLHADAFTTGKDVFFRQGAYAPGSSVGLQLLAHELTHVVQQSGGGGGGRLLLDLPGDAHEREADRVAGAVVSTANGGGVPPTQSASAGRLQRSCAAGESFYQAAPNYCADSWATSLLHRGQRCYREVPVRTTSDPCPPGNQFCFDEDGKCHSSYDKVSPVWGLDEDGTCDLGIWSGKNLECIRGHVVEDKVIGTFYDVWVKPYLEPVFKPAAEQQADCATKCMDGPKWTWGSCIRDCR